MGKEPEGVETAPAPDGKPAPAPPSGPPPASATESPPAASTSAPGVAGAPTTKPDTTTEKKPAYDYGDHDHDDDDEDRSEFPEEPLADDHDRESDHVADDAPRASPAPATPKVVHVTRTPQWHNVVLVDDDAVRIELGPVKIVPVKEDWKTRLARHVRALEGCVPEMYLDHKGYVTVGIGHKLSGPKSTHHIPFQFKSSSGKSASNEDKEAEWERVHAAGKDLRLMDEAEAKKGSKKAAKGARPRRVPGTLLCMSNSAIDELFNRDWAKAFRDAESGYDAFANWKPGKPPQIKFPTFSTLPDSAKMVLSDMAFGHGKAGLFGGRGKGGYPKMLTAMKAGDWEKATEECHIGGVIRETRNNRLRALLQQAAQEAQTPAAAKPAEPTPSKAKPAPTIAHVTPRVTTVNTIGGRKRQPMVHPRVRILAQWDPRWNRKPNRAPGILLKPPWPELDEKNHRPYANWQNSGCCPVALAMVLRWWAEDNPATQGKLQFPHGPAPGRDGSPPMNPVDVNHRLHGTIFVPGKKKAGQTLTISGKRVFAYGIDYMKTIHAPQSVSLGDDPKKKMQVVWTSCHSAEKAKDLLRRGLAYGPMLANMTCPGHFVVVQGYRDGMIYICDPGNILQEHWKPVVQQGKEMPAKDQLKVGRDYLPKVGRAYVAIPDKATCTPTRGKPKKPLTWLESVIGLAYFFFDEKELHPEWG